MHSKCTMQLEAFVGPSFFLPANCLTFGLELSSLRTMLGRLSLASNSNSDSYAASRSEGSRPV